MSILDMPCRHCGQTVRRLALSAMLIDAGCSSSISPDRCPEREGGGDHDFADPKQEAA